MADNRRRKIPGGLPGVRTVNTHPGNLLLLRLAPRRRHRARKFVVFVAMPLF